MSPHVYPSARRCKNRNLTGQRPNGCLSLLLCMRLNRGFKGVAFHPRALNYRRSHCHSTPLFQPWPEGLWLPLLKLSRPLVGCYAHVIQDGQGKSISYRTLLQGFLRPVKEGPTGIFDHLQHARWWGSSFIKMACSPSACHCTLLTLFKPKIGQTCVLPTKFRLQQVSSLK